MGTMPPLVIADEVDSTNAQVRTLAMANSTEWPHLSALLARRQVAGKGRSGRTWSTAEHSALTFSMVLRPRAEPQDWGWLPLVAGAAVVRALQNAGGRSSGLKWPNDVVYSGSTDVLPEWGRLRKVGGLLAEVLPDRSGVVLGVGVNLAGAHLPVPWAGTAADLGVAVAAPELADAIRTELSKLLHMWDGGAQPRKLVTPVCLTLGTRVRISLPSGGVLEGQAHALAADGGLLVRTGQGEEEHVLAGDVTHLRPLL